MPFILKQLIELEGGDYYCFKTRPALFEKEGYKVILHRKSNPSYNTSRKRKMFTKCVYSCKESLIKADKMTQKDYDRIYPQVQQMEYDDSIEIQGFDFIQFCVQKKRCDYPKM